VGTDRPQLSGRGRRNGNCPATAARREVFGFLAAARSEVALARKQLPCADAIPSIGVSCRLRTPAMIVCGRGAPRVWRRTLDAHYRWEEGMALGELLRSDLL